MEVTRELAADIVIEMKKIIGKDINYIATDGEIIASTDKKRIGTYHQGALKVIKSKKALIVENNEEYGGTREGVNLPVKFEKSIVGVIGISGKKEDVEKYGQIIKKMTEILIKEAYMKEEQENTLEYEKILLENILLPEKYMHRTITLSKNIEEMEIKEDGTVIAVELSGFDTLIKGKRCIEIVRRIVKGEKGYLMVNQGTVILLFFKKNRKKIEKVLKKISDNLIKNDNIGSVFGIGKSKKNLTLLRESYLEAMESLEWSLKNHQDLFFYEDMGIELILNNTPNDIKENFLNMVFKNLTIEELNEYREILCTYEKHNGSLDRISKELFIHKNTLQYKINKLKEKNGLDMRKYRDFTILKIAFMCYV
ncbi:Carbohydrate diacid regulator [Fusobacterium sp. DD29]|uniref:CdaR family transcriptional regulator n=1 Tax=unclassified Fusobacterium TaxID=2648384 RepID=UPI001B8D44A9|nr:MULTISPECIES: sugar diacid recognition domain-containing protein [unclassified Fusobacterium]MBR8702007.1 Carbohydrate diacid regulator [Fusobacterium sp. DD45]MBR8711801.1 Carbohydrate diacid regulator [Fusobacterium sp. DD28]MBR8750229.1 Carbohydrate diacid regulator [Fusobacterium sp. DD29]MBR8752370.1 Carbohydrate diacid regulator [Fusobacterium sp. DD26]MBR8762470.1 Carbohydrate diacid regulator [Fusobacterium sp. DD25]